MTKRILGILLTFCLVLTLIPTAISAAAPAAQARYQSAADGQWQEGTLNEALSGVYDGGRVEVLHDIDMDTGLTVTKRVTIASADPENPCSIFYAAQTDFLLTVRADTVLENIILDGRWGEDRNGPTAQNELVIIQNGAQLVLNAGAVLQNNDNASTSKSAGGLRITSGCRAIMQANSVIRNCRGYAGGGVSVASEDASLVLNGGCIEDCEAVLGGGIIIEASRRGGTVYLYDGSTIRNNRAVKDLGRPMYSSSSPKGCGGGIHVERGAVYMVGAADGCAVTGNSAESCGGGIYLNGMNTVGGALLQLARGCVSGNHAVLYGGGIAGSPYANILLDNEPQVTENTNGNDDHIFYNIYLDGMEDYRGAPPTRPTIIGAALGKHASIGISRWLRPDADHPYRIVAVPSATYTITDSDLEKFFSDDPVYVPLLHEGNIVLATADVIFDNQGHGTAPQSQRVTGEHKVVCPTDPEEPGYIFGGWFREPTGETPWSFETDTVLETQTEPLTLYAKWELIHYPITYELDGGENAAGNPASYTIENERITLKAPTRKGYIFQGWLSAGEDILDAAPSIPHGSTGEKTFTAQWKKETSASVPIIPVQPENPKHSGTTAFPLEMKDHFAYIAGYPDGTVRPQAYMTRAEVAAVFFRLMTEEFRQANWAAESYFPDVYTGSWYCSAVATGAQAGLLHGCSDGSFHGERSITRAEFAAIAARFDSTEYQGPDLFSDIPGHWAAAEINRAAQKGWIHGYPDGTFRPDTPITRAEVMVLINRMLHRIPPLDGGMTLSVLPWKDNPKDAWYYLDVQEATNSHTYERDSGQSPEIWVSLIQDRDWTALEYKLRNRN